MRKKTRSTSLGSLLPAMILGLVWTATVSCALIHPRMLGGERIVVRDAGELLEAIGSNRAIYLEPNLYELSAAFQKGARFHPHFQYDSDSDQFRMHNLKNFTLIGAGPGSTRLVLDEEFAHVLAFSGGENIRIRGVELSHRPPANSICLGAALGMHGTRRVRIEDVVLKGSGTFGLWLEDVEDLELTNSVITECTRGIVWTGNSRGLRLRDSVFLNNNGGFNFEDTKGVRIEDSRIVHNRADLSEDYSKYIFDLKNSALVVSDSLIERNRGQGLVRSDRKTIQIKDTERRNNSWVSGQKIR